MKFQPNPYWAMLLLFIAASAGCSFPGMSGEAAACPDLKVAFAGVDKPMICAGDALTVRVRMVDESADVTFMITASSGSISPVPDEKSTWMFNSDDTPGTTDFRVFMETGCGSAASTFDVLVVACDETEKRADSQADELIFSTDDSMVTAKADTDTSDASDSGSASVTAMDQSTDAANTDTDDSVQRRSALVTPPDISYTGPRHVILFIGDGMGENCEIGLSRYLYGTDSGLIFHRFPYANYVTTWDVDTYNYRAANVDADSYASEKFDPALGYDPALGGERMRRGDAASWDYLRLGGYAATDSGAAATAMATGQKTDGGNIAWRSGDPDDGAMRTIAEDAKLLGMKMGVVSSVGFSHATPAAFVSHNTTRGDYHGIADEIIFDTQPDVVIGAGHPGSGGSYGFVSEMTYNWLRLTDTVSFAEWMLGTDGSETLAQAADDAASWSQPLFGLFGMQTFGEPMPEHNPGDPGFNYVSSEEPTLPEATLAALKVLGNAENGFFLMVEGGAIDKANHGNDYPRMIGNMWGFERAVKTAVDWVNADVDGDLVDMENTLIIVTADHANGYITHSEANPLGIGELPQRLSALDSDSEVVIETDPGATYATTGHTSEMVRVYATGAGIAGGAEALFMPYEYLFYPEYPMIDNTHIYQVMAHFLGVEKLAVEGDTETGGDGE